jgi:predicted nucleic acid-binding protein
MARSWRRDVLAAIDIHQQTAESFWDAMILRSAKELGCELPRSEHLSSACDRTRRPQASS